jgi:hypothetical protein
MDSADWGTRIIEQQTEPQEVPIGNTNS